jgi:hypothetical protein
MIPFVGPSYTLNTRAADVQRTVGMYPAPVESGSGKAAFMLAAVPGLVTFCDTMTGIGRGCFELNGFGYCVVGNRLYRISTDGAASDIGTLVSNAGPVEIDANSNELFLVDGITGYTFNFASEVFVAASRVSDIGGSKRTAYLDQYAIYAPDGSQFYVSGLGDAAAIDALDFASAEARPDKLISFLVCNRQLYLLGAKSAEVWLNTGGSDFPLSRYEGMVMSVGCLAPYSARVLNGAPVWLGSDESGQGSVWMAQGYQPKRISTRSIEEAFKRSTDLTLATAYTHQWRGSYFYCINLPGLDTTFCYDALSQSWHERAELSNGDHSQHRVMGCMSLGGHDLALGSDGVLYRWDAETNNNAGDTLLRERVSPHNATMESQRQFFGAFEVDCDRGLGGVVLMRYSNDGGATWCDWKQRSLGELGHYRQRLIWNCNGSARDRVWHVRCTDDVPFNIVHAFSEMA